MTLRLPPAQPPADEIADLLEHLAAVRSEVAHADAQAALLLVALADDAATVPGLSSWAAYRHGTYFGLELRVARERQKTWRQELAAAEAHAARLGVSL